MLALTFTMCAMDPAPPPKPAKRPKTFSIHGVTLTDDYFWLRDRKNPEVIAYLEAENAYAASWMAATAPLQERLYGEMVGRIRETDTGVPYKHGAFFYYTRTEKGKQYPIYCRRKGTLEAPEEVVLDLNEMAKGKPFFAIGAYEPSDDGSLLAYTTDTTGYRQYTLHVRDLASGRDLPDTVERVRDVEWASVGRTLFFVTEHPVTKRSDRFWRREIGGENELVIEEKDELFDLSAARSLDGKYLFVGAHAKTSTEYRFLRADQPRSAPTLVLARSPGHEYDVDHHEGRFYIRSNKGAVNFRVVRIPAGPAGGVRWEEFIPHDPAVKISGLLLFAGHCVVMERQDGLPHLRVIDMKTGRSHRIASPEPVYMLSPGPNREYATPVLRFHYQSMVTPPSAFDYDMRTRRRKLLKEEPVLGGFDKANYKAERRWAAARDGTKVPLSIVFRKNVARDGKAPLLLYGYGSYGHSLPASFQASRLSLLDRGVIYAIAHVRGGGELGEEWRQAGRMMRKMNTFTDFIDAAEWLVANRYTSPARLAIQGGSAGGLLVGAVVNLRPELFRAAVAHVPFVDVINTMLDASLPLTTSEYLEWGNPNEPEAFAYIRRYSPYDNVAAQAYPAMLVRISLNDSQVPYWEGAKWVARLREHNTGPRPILLKANLSAGHGGASGRYDALRELAFDYAFLLTQWGLAD